MDITLSIAKNAAFNEVSKITSFIGAKMPTEQGDLYEQVAVTNDDFHVLEKFWRESITSTISVMKRFYKSSTTLGSGAMVDLTEIFEITLKVPNRFDESLEGSINDLFYNYIVNSIVAKWLPLTFRNDAEYYQKNASANMADILVNIYHQTYPQR